jgi:predicted unusual protein kinase regulating ubiquinone biosynthesis (AarF/ABC1/UbiB family)
MKTLDSIPQSKVHRASKLLKMGAQVGGNYVKYLGDRLVNDEKEARDRLNAANANNIYNGLSELKGSALKMAQMLSMDDGVLPKEYVEKFSLAQFNVPPLSGPLAKKAFMRALGISPESAFTKFNTESSYAASIGQVHEAWINDRKYAVKIQYPGVSESVLSDLGMVKPIALRMFNLRSDEVEDYFQEVQNKLLEETDYLQEAKNLVEVRETARKVPNVKIPSTHEEFSGKTVLTMEWIDGNHLSEFCASEPDVQNRNRIAQTLWDFYLYHIHTYRKVHADPHPGNFKVTANNKLAVLDFGCMKGIPEDFYESFFKLTDISNIEEDDRFLNTLHELDLINADDSEEDVRLIKDTFREMLLIINQPFQHDSFDFSDPSYYKKLLYLGSELKDNKALKQLKGKRGSRHFVYVNRTLIGLLGLMNSLNAGPVNVSSYKELEK